MADPCRGLPVGGVCLSASQVARCAAATGNSQPQVVMRVCAATEECQVLRGVAECVARSGTCVAGEQSCVSATRIRVCSQGMWQETACPGACRSSPLGAFCASLVTTTAYRATMKYQARGPNAMFTDWSTSTVDVAAQGLLVASVRGDAIVDAVTTDSTGAFTIAIPSPWQAGDRLIALAIRANDDQTGLAYAVAQPDVPDGELNVTAAPGPRAQTWSWTIDPVRWPSGSSLVITEAIGSGAVRVFDYLRYSHAYARARFGRAGPAVVVWLRMNTSWTCGACFLSAPSKVGSLPFDSQIFVSASRRDQTFWADPVTAHEIGHWAMWAYGTSPNESGQHCAAQPTLPGQAWSEGWATAFSSIVRDDSLYYDKQEGSMFWFDLAARGYVAGGWQRPIASAGLHQPMDENEVAAMLWAFAGRPDVGSGRIFTALASPTLNASTFARGYTRHIWEMNGCMRYNVRNTRQSAPMVADFLDALRCGGVPAAAIDAVTIPAMYYPYPSGTPLCQ